MKKSWLAALAILVVFLPLNAAKGLPQPEKIQLANGMTVFFLRDAELPLVAFRLYIKGAGTAFESSEGLADIAAELLLKGASGKTAAQVAEEIDFLGASLVANSQDEFMEISGSSLAANFPALMAIASECLLKPGFSQEEFEKERARRLDTIMAVKDNPGQAVRYYFRKAYFGSHPLGHLDIGTQSSLQKMTVETIRDFYKRLIVPQQAVMAVAGDLASEDLKKLLDSTLARWPKTGAPAAPARLPAFPAPSSKVCILIDKPDASQAYFTIGVPGFPTGDRASAAAQVMNTLFGGRFTSWLNTELRIKRGLTYGANSRFQSWRNGGIFTASSYTKNDSIGQMLDITLGLIARAKKEGFGPEEIESARNYILGQFPPTLESLGAKAGAYLTLDFYGLGFGYYTGYLERIEKTEKAQADAVAKRYFPEQDFVLVVVGKAEEIAGQLAKFGDFKVKKISDPDF